MLNLYVRKKGSKFIQKIMAAASKADVQRFVAQPTFFPIQKKKQNKLKQKTKGGEGTSERLLAISHLASTSQTNNAAGDTGDLLSLLRFSTYGHRVVQAHRNELIERKLGSYLSLFF